MTATLIEVEIQGDMTEEQLQSILDNVEGLRALLPATVELEFEVTK
jgi:hypothetical protein